MGFSDWNSTNWDFSEGGFNAEDYMVNLDRSIGKSQGSLTRGLTESMFSDFNKQQQSWMEGMKQAEGAWKGSQNFGNRENELYQETLGSMEGYNEQSRDAYEKYGEEQLDATRKYRSEVEGWAGNVQSRFDEGADKARGFSQDALSKLEDVEGEYEDFSTQALAGQASGITSRFQNQKSQQLDAARRGGAPQSALDQMSYSMDQEMGAQLQTQVSQSAGKYQEGMVQLGTQVAGQMQQMAGMEGQLASAGAAVDDRVLQTKMKGLDIETQTKLSNAESLRQLENSFAEYGRTEALAHQQRALRAEELKFQGNTQYGDYIMNHPPTAEADMWALMISYATMPRSGDVGRAMLPGMRHKEQMRKEEEWKNQALDSFGRPLSGGSRVTYQESPYSF